MHCTRYNTTLVSVALLVVLTPLASADKFIVDKETSLLGFINHKRGVASILIVDPLTYPGEYAIDIAINPTMEYATFSLRYDAEDIQVAGAEMVRRWGPSILEAGATKKPLQAPSPSRQRKIRKVVLSEKFLHAAKYPQVSVNSLGIEKLAEPAAGDPHTHQMTIGINMHGKTVEATFPATIALEGDRLTFDAAFPLELRDFNIKPYSALFGAVRFANVFHVYMHFEAKRMGATSTEQ
ncbi:MAG: YceI family protein [Candidatus Hydrogenedentes bacterium]|nr:YceI family protein [Candidatus Hydrogenedentota bacterium]